MKRDDFTQEITFAFRNHPVVAILGPRQCGKTTLAHQYIKTLKDFPSENYFDLEDPAHLHKLLEAKMILENLSGLVVIDEIQRIPNLFPQIRVLVDKPNKNHRYLILGSASRDLIHQSSETLAGRIKYVELTPFSYQECDHWDKLWLRGGFPRSYLAKTDADSMDWRKAYITTFLERDIPNLGIKIPPLSLRRFWMMLSHYHGQIFNASEIGHSLGISDTTVKRYLDILTGTFMIRQLTPWLENIKKRQIKSPKIYFRDSGIFHSLIGITTHAALIVTPKLGASWEGTALEAIIRYHHAGPEECYFWGIHGQAELDLLIFKNGNRIGFEIKFTQKPKITASIQNAQKYLNLDVVNIIIPGTDKYSLSKEVNVFGIEKYLIGG